MVKLARISALIVIALGLIGAVFVFKGPAANASDASPLPDSHRTPGSVDALRSSNAVLCANPSEHFPALSAPRLSKDVRKQVMKEYGIGFSSRSQYSVDLVVPTQLGGDTSVANAWPQRKKGPMGVNAKNKVENHLRRMVCNGQLPLEEAQSALKANWIEAGHRFGVVSGESETEPEAPIPTQSTTSTTTAQPSVTSTTTSQKDRPGATTTTSTNPPDTSTAPTSTTATPPQRLLEQTTTTSRSSSSTVVSRTESRTVVIERRTERRQVQPGDAVCQPPPDGRVVQCRVTVGR